SDCHEVKKEGTGIGLAFSRELVKLHEGTIHAENNKNGGLTIYLELPLEKLKAGNKDLDLNITNEEHQEALPWTDQTLDLDTEMMKRDKREDYPSILLVEDNQELRTFLDSQLSNFYKVIIARNGLEGFNKAKAQLPDLILSDVMMPEMTGIEMLDKLKNEEETSHIPVILLTAKSSVENQIEGLSYGADFYITKPFRSDFLLSAIKSLIAGRKKIFETYLNKNVVVDL